MSSRDEPWFVTERSEALAGVLLTARKDVRVRDKKARDDGLVFLVEVGADDLPTTRLFEVLVKGTLSSDPKDWGPDVEPFFAGLGGPISLPMCVVVVDVRENRAFLAWAAEPRVEADGATLRLHRTSSFRLLDARSVDDIIDRVKAWYQALANQLIPA